MNRIKKRVASYSIIGIFFIALGISINISASLSEKDDFKKQQMNNMYQQYQQEAFPNASTVTVEQLLTWQRSGEVILVDVRTPEERAISRIPSAITLEEFQENINSYSHYKIVFYCTIGYRSGIETEKAQQQNLDAHNLHGGVLAWSHIGQPFLRDDRETRDVHVYGKKWNLTPQGYNPVW
jgi:rhodanese-related sulfurtransferase